MAKKSRRPVRGAPTYTATTPTGEPAMSTVGGRTTRRTRRTRQPSLYERYRTWILVGVGGLGVLIVGYLLFAGGTTAAFTCGSLLTPGPVESLTPQPSILATPTPAASESPAAETPAATGTPAASAPAASPAASPSPAVAASPASTEAASPAPSASPGASSSAEPTPAPAPTPRLGFTTEILGRTHVPVGTVVNYGFCPPTSGNHYQQPAAPIPARVYPPSDAKPPQYWIHNLEHGYVVAAYRCPSGVIGQGDCISTEEMAQMQAFFDQAPDSGIAGCPKKVVVIRFDEMTTDFAMLAWGRALLTNDFDIDTAITFTEQWMDHDAVPEKGSC